MGTAIKRKMTHEHTDPPFNRPAGAVRVAKNQPGQRGRGAFKKERTPCHLAVTPVKKQRGTFHIDPASPVHQNQSCTMSFVPYQVDYTVTGKGKTLGISKKRITFKFGFANRKALADGLTGAACRGSEHEVIYIWSVASGKRHIMADGREVHFSESGKNWGGSEREFNFPFAIRVPGIGSLQCRIIADSSPGARPFDLRINNMSYFHFSKIYEMGTPSMRVGQLTPQNVGVNDEAYAPPEERRLIAQAKLESMRELRAMQEQRSRPPPPEPPKMEREEGNLISFEDDTAVPAQGAVYQASSITMDTLSPPGTNQRSLENDGFNQDSSAYGTNQPQYSNYVVNPYGAQPQFQQPPAPASYAQAPAPYPQAPAPYAQAPSSYSQASAPYAQEPAPYAQAPSSYSQASAPYAQEPAPYAQAPSSYSQASDPYAQAPAAYSQPPAAYQSTASYGGYSQQQSFTAAPPPTFEETQAAFASPSYGGGSAPAFASPSYGGSAPAFASPQSQMSYGSSAPGFAQPPKTPAPAPNYGAYPNGAAW